MGMAYRSVPVALQQMTINWILTFKNQLMGLVSV